MLLLLYHREVLSDIFEVIDIDGNGLLSLEEYNFFELRTSGEKCDKEAWAVCKGHHFLYGTDAQDGHCYIDVKTNLKLNVSGPSVLLNVQRTLI